MQPVTNAWCRFPELPNACLLIAMLDALLLDHANRSSAVHFAPLDVAPFGRGAN